MLRRFLSSLTGTLRFDGSKPSTEVLGYFRPALRDCVNSNRSVQEAERQLILAAASEHALASGTGGRKLRSMNARFLRVLTLLFAGGLSLQSVAFCQGLLTETQRKQLFEEMRAKAEKGDSHAQFSIGALYDSGYGVEKDYVEAVKWYRKAAEQGYPPAQDSLGGMYHMGRGVNKDYAEALKWYRKAAEQRNSGAQYVLGIMYELGDGVEKDYVEAYAWYSLAAKTDETLAEDRDKLRNEMSQQQLAKAEKRTKELKALIEAKMKRE